MGDQEVELSCIINSIVWKYCSTAFIWMVTHKVFIRRLLRTNLYGIINIIARTYTYYVLSSFQLYHKPQVSPKPRIHLHLRVRHTCAISTHASTHARTHMPIYQLARMISVPGVWIVILFISTGSDGSDLSSSADFGFLPLLFLLECKRDCKVKCCGFHGWLETSVTIHRFQFTRRFVGHSFSKV